METYIGIPCYGVAKSIEGVLNRLLKVRKDLHIILVNDGSKDNLSEVIKKYDKSPFLSFNYFEHEKNKGYGGAQKTIFKKFQSLSKNKDDLLIFVHGDGQTLESEIDRFIKEAKKHPEIDAILGSRMLNSFSDQWKNGRPAYKILSDYILTKIENHLYNLKLSTYASGYRCIKRKGVDKIDFSNTSDKHVFDTESLILFRFFNVNYKEIPVKVVPNDTGLSANNLKAYAKNTIDLAFKYGYEWKKRCIKYLIINSDDYGYSKSINDGIAYAFSKNTITSATILTNLEFFDDAIIKAREGNYLNKIGLHVNLTEGKPLGKNYKTIIDHNGYFLNINKLILKSLLKKIDKKEIEEEIELQIKKCIEKNFIPSHIDTHQWCQILRPVSDAVINLANKYEIYNLRNIKESYIFRFTIGARLKSIINSLVVFFASHMNPIKLKNGKVFIPDFYLGIILTGHKKYKKCLIKILNKLKPGVSELMCHVGGENSTDVKSYFKAERFKELQILSSQDIKDIIRKNNIRLISYRELNKVK